MHQHLKLVGALQMLAGLYGLGALFSGLGWLLLADPAMGRSAMLFSPEGAIICGLLGLALLISLAALFAGWQLLQQRPSGRALLKWAAAFELLLLPLGTALGLFTFWILARHAGPPQWQLLAAQQRAAHMSVRRFG